MLVMDTSNTVRNKATTTVPPLDQRTGDETSFAEASYGDKPATKASAIVAAALDALLVLGNDALDNFQRKVSYGCWQPTGG